jgi:hypothetical protein
MPQALRSNSPKVKVSEDSRWADIQQAAKAASGDGFLQDLVAKGTQYGELTSKQMGAGYNAARKVLDKGNERVGQVAKAFDLQPGEEPF